MRRRGLPLSGTGKGGARLAPEGNLALGPGERMGMPRGSAWCLERRRWDRRAHRGGRHGSGGPHAGTGDAPPGLCACGTPARTLSSRGTHTQRRRLIVSTFGAQPSRTGAGLRASGRLNVQTASAVPTGPHRRALLPRCTPPLPPGRISRAEGSRPLPSKGHTAAGLIP